MGESGNMSVMIMIVGKPATWFEEDTYNGSSRSSYSSNSTSTSGTSPNSSASTSSSTSGTSSSSKSASSDSKSSSSTSKSSSSNTKPSSSKNKSSAANARKSAENYDAGYNAIYEDDDYSQKRYNKDSDYAAGVDDAIDDLDWE